MLADMLTLSVASFSCKAGQTISWIPRCLLLLSPEKSLAYHNRYQPVRLAQASGNVSRPCLFADELAKQIEVESLFQIGDL